jgi:uncharacterized membrane protein SpoIIM required for sporulation
MYYDVMIKTAIFAMVLSCVGGVLRGMEIISKVEHGPTFAYIFFSGYILGIFVERSIRNKKLDKLILEIQDYAKEKGHNVRKQV